MSPYKRRVSAIAIAPHFESSTAVPKGGLDKTLDAVHEFHRRHRIEAHTGKGRRDKSGHNYVGWCFANPEIAANWPTNLYTVDIMMSADPSKDRTCAVPLAHVRFCPIADIARSA